jgi:hypothetical protein
MATMTPSISPELVSALKRLKLGRLVDTLPDRLVLADKQEMSFDDLLLLVLTDEIARRDSTAAGNRAREAGLDPAMRLESWNKTAKVTFDKRMLAELSSLLAQVAGPFATAPADEATRRPRRAGSLT